MNSLKDYAEKDAVISAALMSREEPDDHYVCALCGDSKRYARKQCYGKDALNGVHQFLAPETNAAS